MNIMLKVPLEIMSSQIDIKCPEDTSIKELVHVRTTTEHVDVLDEEGNLIGVCQIQPMHHFFLDKMMIKNSKED